MYVAVLGYIKIIVNQTIQTFIVLQCSDNIFAEGKEVSSLVGLGFQGPVTLSNFVSNLSHNAPQNEKQEVCACALVKTAVKLRDKLVEG